MKHFNRSFVFGTVDEMKEEDTQNGKPYINVVVNCSCAQYGNVKAFGKLWGKNAVASFKKQFKKGDSLKLTGILTQFTGRDNALRTSFNFYKAEPWDQAADQHPFRRATFILVGEVVSFMETDGEGALRLKVVIESKEQTRVEEHVFEVNVPPGFSLDFPAEFPAGSSVRIKGRLVQTEDEYGDVVKYTRPLAGEISLAVDRGGEEAPF